MSVAVLSDIHGVLPALWHSFTIWFFVAIISLPVGIGIALLLARTNMPFSRGIEFCFWIAYIFPPLSSAFGWIYLMDPDYGFLNKLVEHIPGVSHGPFNVFSVPGMVFVRLMSDGIAYFVIGVVFPMLLFASGQYAWPELKST